MFATFRELLSINVNGLLLHAHRLKSQKTGASDVSSAFIIYAPVEHEWSLHFGNTYISFWGRLNFRPAFAMQRGFFYPEQKFIHSCLEDKKKKKKQTLTRFFSLSHSLFTEQ